MSTPTSESLIEAITELALDIARLCPDCADKANQLVGLVRQLQPASIDRGAIQDAIETETAGSDVSEIQVRTTTEAVMRAAREKL